METPIRVLLSRTTFINNERPNLVVSIHANSATSCGDGVEAWYSSTSSGGKANPNLEVSRQLAQKLASNINKTFGLRLRRSNGIADAAGRLHMVREPVVPSALIETAFISNKTEAILLRDRPADFAAAIAKAIMEQLGVTTPTPPPPVSCATSQYKTEYFNNKTLSGSPTFSRCENSPINYDWAGGGPGNGVGVDNFSVRWTGRFSFGGGDYAFIARADDGIRVWVDGNMLIDAWRDQSATEYRANRNLSSGEHEVKVEYYENGGGAVAQVRWEQASLSCSNQYKAEYYNNKTLSGSPTYVRCENWPINWDWGSGGPGNGIGNDNFSARWTGQVYINAGNYTFIARSDDGIRVWLDGSLMIDKWFDQGATEYKVTKSVSAGNHSIQVEYYENGGGAVAQFRWEQATSNSPNLALNRSTWTTSTENTIYPAYKGNDGNTGTRWSSASRGADEWWRVDLGSALTFDRVIIRWEAAYSAYHFVGWSSDGTNFTGYWYSIPSVGNYSYSLGTQSYRYVAVLMRTRAPCCGNFSFWEFEVYRSTSMSLKDLRGIRLLDPTGEMETIQLMEAPIPTETPEITPEAPPPTENQSP